MPVAQRLRHLSLEHAAAMKLTYCVRGLAPEDESSLPAIAHRIREVFALDLVPHFADEERSLCPRLVEIGRQDLADRLAEEHRRLSELVEALAEPTPTRIREFSKELREHVIFEENVVFEVLEAAEGARRKPAG